jgi:8-oxo-dGTP pyrophosphatase MutT (NUDIX family)
MDSSFLSESEPGYERRGVRILHENRWARLELWDIVHPNGTPGEHTLIRVPQPSGVVAVDGNDVLLTSQRRFAIDETVLEIIKGTAEEDEDALACARREAYEEAGLVGGDWSPLGFVYEIPSVVASAIQIFLAQGFTVVQPAPDCVESIAVVRMPLPTALRRALGGGINDAVTAAALCRAGAALGILEAPN